MKRRYLLRHVVSCFFCCCFFRRGRICNLTYLNLLLQGVEIFSEDQAHMLLVFATQKERDRFYDLVLKQPSTCINDTQLE